MARKCVVPDCDRVHLARGFCSMHWAQWSRGSEVLAPLSTVKLKRKKCSIWGCKKLSEARDFCGAHYRVWRRDNNLDPKQSKDYIDTWGRSFVGRWSQLKRAARVLGLGFDITKEQHKNLVEKPCHYCNGSINPTGHALDRKDSSKGYFFSNVVTCCYSCNKIKSDLLTFEEMVYTMKCLLNFRKKGGSCGS